MENKIELSKDEISEITRLNSDYQQIVLSLGELEIEKKQLTDKLSNIENLASDAHTEFKDITKREVLFKERLFEKYGDGEIDVQFGVYIKK
tara:strand:+ start:5773 stop:6045 length:273 start_codon:yes stop_codon:yes gene_type:complete